MDSKKIIIFLVVLVLLGGGFYIYQTKKQDKELTAYNQKKFQDLTAAAEKSSSAGMLNMALAIKKYHQAKGHYPKVLLDLYPTFIPDKAFITALNWEYETQNKNYLLKKTAKGKKTFAAIGPDLQLRKGRIDSPVSAQKVAALSKSKTGKTVANAKTGPTESDLRKKIKTTFVTQKKDVMDQQEKEKKKPAEPEVKIVKKDLGKNEKFLLALSNRNLYIWKTKDGIIGFSNIQYPDEKNLTIFRNESWVEYGVSHPASSPKNSL